jgi:CheY-like chemotaxis protein
MTSQGTTPVSHSPGCSRILVVDDDAGIRDMLTQLLEDEGYGVVTAADGQIALTQLRQGNSPPCLILLDLMMPVMNGVQFRSEQQQDSWLASIPVVVISAHLSGWQRAHTVQAADYLEKPVDLPKLLDIVARYCGASASGGA